MPRHLPAGRAGRPWTTLEIRSLRQSYGMIPVAQLAAKLQRTEMAVIAKAFMLGFSAAKVAEWSSTDLADVLGVSKSTVVRWIQRGLLRKPRSQTSRWVNISDAELRRFIAARPDLARADRMPESEYRAIAIDALKGAAA